MDDELIGAPDPRGSLATQSLPPQARMGLLGYITSTSLDEDYAHVRDKRAAESRSGTTPRTRRARPGMLAVLAFALFGVLVATAGIETARNQGLIDSNRASLVAQVNDGRELLEETRAELGRAETEVAAARAAHAASQSSAAVVHATYERVGAWTGELAVQGPGLRLVADDAVGARTDSQRVLGVDLRDIVNALWFAGAEAVSINGERLTPLSAISSAGRTIIVNYTDVRAPYEILAIGNARELERRFYQSTTGQIWMANRNAYGLRFTLSRRGELNLPAASSARLQLRAASILDGAQGQETEADR